MGLRISNFGRASISGRVAFHPTNEQVAPAFQSRLSNPAFQSGSLTDFQYRITSYTDLRDGICEFLSFFFFYPCTSFLLPRLASNYRGFVFALLGVVTMDQSAKDSAASSIPPMNILTRSEQPRPNPYNQGYLANGAVPHQTVPVPGATPLLPNQGRVIQSGPIRVLCIADVRGTILPPRNLLSAAHIPYPALCLWC